MNETALIVAVPEAEALVSRFREKYDASAAGGVPAHVTLLYPFLEPDSVGVGEVAALTTLIATSPAFDVRFTRCRRFEPKTLWLAPKPDTSFRRLTNLIVARWPECPPYRGAYPDIIPHLTVSDSVSGDLLDRIEMAVAGGLPVSARVSEALLIENRSGQWTTRETFALGS